MSFFSNVKVFGIQSNIKAWNVFAPKRHSHPNTLRCHEMEQICSGGGGQETRIPFLTMSLNTELPSSEPNCPLCDTAWSDEVISKVFLQAWFPVTLLRCSAFVVVDYNHINILYVNICHILHIMYVVLYIFKRQMEQGGECKNKWEIDRWLIDRQIDRW